MKHLVLYSGGLGSYFTAKRLLERGVEKKDLTLLFTDTFTEDEDLYRFLDDSTKKLGMEITKFSDGRDIWEVFHDEKFLGNSRVDVCSQELKRRMSRKYIKQIFIPSQVIIYLGFDWTEVDRFEKAKKAWLPYIIQCPLIEKPYIGKEEMKQMIVEDGIELPRLYRLGFSHNNCFSGETRFITDEGMKDFASTVGTKQNVLSNGNFVEAEVKSFGKQNLFKLTVQKNKQKKEIFTTENHRWILYNGERGNSRKEKYTRELMSGDFLVSMYGNGMSNVRPSAFGISHGIVFGDGTKNTAKNSFAFINLCGEKNSKLVEWFPNSPKTKTKQGTKISDLPRYFKDFPSIKESKSYLLGWLSGYFASDGSVSKDGSSKISSSNKENLLFVKDVCAKLSIGTMPITCENRIGINKKYSNLYTMYFAKETLFPEFFLIENHRNRYLENLPKNKQRITGWKVISVEKTERFESVFCLEVPKNHNFTLDDNILTGNCGGGCVKAGIGHFHHLLKTMPERYKTWEEEEQKMIEFLGKDVSILRRMKNGVSKNITLKQLREEQETLTQEELCDIGGCGCFQD